MSSDTNGASAVDSKDEEANASDNNNSGNEEQLDYEEMSSRAGDGDEDQPVDGSEAADNDPDIIAIKKRVEEMEREAETLRRMQEDLDGMSSPASSGAVQLSLQEKMEIDGRSVFVGNVDYAATADDLERHFHGCGSVNRVTILCDKYTGHPKGFAYIEFAEKDAVETATALDDSLFKGRQIKVTPKRTNRPGVSTTNRGGRSMGRGRARGGFGGGFGGRGFFTGGFRPFRGRPFSRRGWFSPY